MSDCEEKPTVKFVQKASLEPIKTKFFNGDFDGFLADAQNENFTLWIADYKDDESFGGKPHFIVKNLVNGMVTQLEDSRKYLFASFQCVDYLENNYQIRTAWICNTVEDIKEVIPDTYDSFTWCKVDLTDVDHLIAFKTTFDRRTDDKTVVITAYCH